MSCQKIKCTFTLALIFYSSLIVSSQYAGARIRNSTRARVVLRGDQPPPPDLDLDPRTHEDAHPFSYWQNRPKGSFAQHRSHHPCEKSSCYPQTGNLLIGREDQLYASSTCGLHGAERYCIVSHLEERKKCFWCDSTESIYPKADLNHNISNIVYKVYPGTKQKTWWQSENGKENVYIQLDLEAEFHFTHIIITFKTFRPAAMLIERSFDFKKTWQIYRYFASDCEESYPGVKTDAASNLTDVICDSKYSNFEPSSGGEVIYRVLPQHVRIDNPYSHQVQSLMKVTNLRINFTRLHTLGDNLLDRREEIQEKYYYAITDMVIRGSCSCYGHANRCLPLPGIVPKVDMVHGRCECTHHTKGRNCEKCEDFFNDLPWSPAVGKQTNACKRCNCNNHAISCHFDPAVYEATGKLSGGVCDGCQHNTMGINCEQCKSFFYKDPERDIQDPEVCKPCDCDPHGALDSGICDSATDPNNNLVAGACHCKTNVEGRRCDTCKNGFWNFTNDNPNGCEPCTCHTAGTIDNQGCNVYTGECTCKRYVTGRDCNQCLLEFWGLSEQKDGCEPCDCDPGGSIDNFCDVESGQCQCREHMTGRNCSIPKQQYFTASLDFLLYEAELGKSSPNCQVVIREPYRDGREDTWSGLGFIKSYEGSSIEFDINNIRTSLDYDPIIRYELPTGESWDDITFTLIRPGPPDPNGPCQNALPEYDVHHIPLDARNREVKIFPPICLEKGKDYKIKLDFNKSNLNRDSTSASVLIDSMVLRPHIKSIPWFHGSQLAEARRREFEIHQCSSEDSIRGPVSEVCKNFYKSIGAFINDGALGCQCDKTGSVSRLCDEYGGFCTCKPNVVGRRCDHCAPGTYGFGPEGCIACDCNSIGSLDNYCNSTTGQCECRANTYGRQCDQCRTGFWNFPNCLRCDCNGHADTCEAKTGACIECRDNTQGHTCNSCTEGYYGDPRLNVDIPCRPCPCPGIAGSGHSYADKCSLDVYTKDVVCECQEGYAGSRCDVCADNYYGNPEEPGGTCQLCDCSNKIDLLKPGNCDAKTGICKQCLYDTTGDHCEICKAGYFRSYDSDICAECVCHPLGTNYTAGPCDHNTGQCPCYPNVIGKECDQCAPNFWKIASGSGCESCDCDPIGSLDPQCNLYDGQCHCQPNYGGRQCNECKANYWGNPKLNECHECTCNIYGSATMQCDRKTGACVCQPGIGGYNCDRCARGYIGNAPHCSPCGECFDNWDRILNELKNNTLIEIERAKNIKKVGATGAYTKEFDEMQEKLKEIERLLNRTQSIDLDVINRTTNDLLERIKEINSVQLKELSDNLASASEGNKLKEIFLKGLENKLKLLENKTRDLEQNGTLLQEANVQGALNLIEQAKEKADRAAQKAIYSQKNLEFADRQCIATKNLIEVTKQDFDAKHANDESSLDEIRENFGKLKNEIPYMNDLVCDRHGDPCDSICGGAGCGVCGAAVTCENGAKQQAEMALILANDTEEILKETEKMGNDFIRNVLTVNTTLSKQMAQKTYEMAEIAFKKSNESLYNVNNIKKQMVEFLNQNTSSPEDIEKLAKEVFDKNIELDPEQIKELAGKIKTTVDSLTNIDPIIADTKDDLERGKKLKEDADNAQLKVQDIKNITINVQNALRNSSFEQNKATDAINVVSNDVETVRNLLNDIEMKTNKAKVQINDTSDQISNVTKKIKALTLNITKNEQAASTFKQQSDNIKKEATDTNNNLLKLQKEYNKTKQKLDDTLVNVRSSDLKAKNLVNKAVQLTAMITKIEEDIKRLESIPDHNLQELERQINDLIDKMNGYNDVIQSKSQFYKSCT